MAIHGFESKDFYFNISSGNYSKLSVIHKFGHNADVGTTFEPICYDGIYRTPQVSGATKLRIKAGGNANDTSNGTGARAITLEGIDANGDFITDTISTNGASASSATTKSFLRLYSAYISSSGTYATQSAGSHAGAIIIENSAGGTDWATIEATYFPHGQTEIGAYTVPTGHTAYIKNIYIYVDSSKTATVQLFQRKNILETAAPYTAMRNIYTIEGATADISVVRTMPLGPFPALTDFGFMARVASAAASVSVNFDIILVAD